MLQPRQVTRPASCALLIIVILNIEWVHSMPPQSSHPFHTPFLHHSPSEKEATTTINSSGKHLKAEESKPSDDNVFLPTRSSSNSEKVTAIDVPPNMKYKAYDGHANETGNITKEKPVLTGDPKTVAAVSGNVTKTEDKIDGKTLGKPTASPPTSLSAKHNFFRRRRKPTLESPFADPSEDDTKGGGDDDNGSSGRKSKNITAVDIIMQKIKKAQQFKTGRRTFHAHHNTSSLSNRNRKRIIKVRPSDDIVENVHCDWIN